MGPEALAKVPQLLDAARRGDVMALSGLLSGPDPPALDAQDPTNLRTALMEAAAAGQRATTKWLVKRNSGDKLRDWEGCTPLMLAAARGSVEVVQLLLRRRQRPNVQDYAGWTALMYAAFWNHREVVAALLAGEALRGIKRRQGKTAEDLTTCPFIQCLLRVSRLLDKPLIPAPLSLHNHLSASYLRRS
jgi:ankyrin repeat protein